MNDPATTGSLASPTASAAPGCVTAVPGKYGNVPPGACNAYYDFNPSFEGNLAFAVLFGTSLIGHVIQAILYKKLFSWVIIMGSLWETIAFAIRALGAHDQQKLQYALWGTLLFLLSPLWINAYAYMTIARMIHLGLPEKKIWGVRAAKMTVIFVALDIVCFLVQVVGAGMLSGDSENGFDAPRIGRYIYMTGIAIQLAFIVIFSTMTICFYRLLYRVTNGNMSRMKWLLWIMLSVLALIVVRVVFRLIEYSDGTGADNPLVGREIYPFMLDAFPMLLALVLINIFHPGLVLRGADSEFPHVSRAEKKELKARKKDEKQKRKMAKKHGEYEMTEQRPVRSDWEDGSTDGRRPLI